MMTEQTLFNIAVGIVLSGVGWFSRQLWDAVKELREDLQQLEIQLPSKYVAKDEFAEAVKDLKSDIRNGFDRLYSRIDGKADK